MKEHTGAGAPSDLRIGIVASKWYPEMMGRLIDGARLALEEKGVRSDRIDLARVPGSFELPVGAKAMAGTGRYDAIVVLGIVIRGETTHYDYVAGEAARGVQSVALETGTPVLFGVLTCEDEEQVAARAGGAKGNKGAEAAAAAVELALVLRDVRREGNV